jgi:hypothetical protein
MTREGSRVPKPVTIALSALALLILLRFLHRSQPTPVADDLPVTLPAPVPEPTDAPPAPARGRSRPTARLLYGAHPAHLVLLLVSFALTGYALTFLVESPDIVRIAVWFAAAVVAHDLVLFPLYALADRAATGVLDRRSRQTRTVPAINHLRIPVMASALLLLVYFPAILQQGESTYLRASGLTEGNTYLVRWLLLTAGFCLVSAAVYVVRLARGRRLRRPPGLGG